MGKMQAFSIYDKKTQEYMTPFFAPNVVTALRSLQSTLKQGGTTLNNHPHDFALFKIGEFDGERGWLISSGTLELVEEIANLVPNTQKSAGVEHG